MNLTKDELVNEIIAIMRLDGEDFTDGECLDLIDELLREEGYSAFEAVQVIPEENILEKRPDGTFLYIEHYGDKDDE